MIGVGDWPRFWADYSPDSVVLIDEEHSWTWSTFERRVDQLAKGLVERGVTAGDRVASLTSNRVEHFEIFFACARIGALFVPLNPMLSGVEIAFTCRDADVAVVFTDVTTHGQIDPEFAAASTVAIICIGSETDDEWDALHRAGELPVTPFVTADQPLALCYTSGTTGHPKGAILTHRNIEALASTTIAFDRLTTADRTIATVPLAFTGAGVALALPLLKAGGSVLIRARFDPAQMLCDIAEHSITSIGVVPVLLERMARQPNFAAADLSTWRVAKSGGAPPSKELLSVFQSRGVELAASYGLTEGSGCNLMLPPRDASRKLGSIGIPMIGQQAKIVDKSGAEVGPGERGELLLAGDVVFAGYWRNERASRDALVDGWLYTGDIAVRDEEGYYWIVDRAKDMIISGGINVYPAEVEAVLREHPDVDEIAVVGVADEEWGESPAACVVTDNKALTLDELNDFARDRLARYKRPTRLVFVDGGLPRGMSGKVLKRDLREMLSSSTTRGGS